MFFSALKEQERIDAGDLDQVIEEADSGDEQDLMNHIDRRDETTGAFTAEFEKQVKDEEEKAQAKTELLNKTLDEEV